MAGLTEKLNQEVPSYFNEAVNLVYEKLSKGGLTKPNTLDLNKPEIITEVSENLHKFKLTETSSKKNKYKNTFRYTGKVNKNEYSIFGNFISYYKAGNTGDSTKK